jgi:RNA polymerase sigma factor (sigma-70 family)
MTNSTSASAAPDADDEQSIVQRVVARDRTAFEQPMRRHNRRLYRLARETPRCDADAEDALPEAYLSAYRSIAQFRGDAALFSWLSRLVLNECLGRLRRHARREHIIPMVDMNNDADVDPMAAHDPDPPYQAAARAEVRGLLEHKLDQLPIAFRTVFMLRSVEEMSVLETAQCLDIPEATVRSRHVRARSLLRESLARDIDLAERNLFEFGGDDCDRLVASVLSCVNGTRMTRPPDGTGTGI